MKSSLPIAAISGEEEPQLRRVFVTAQDGQLHARRTESFRDGAVPLLLLHGAAGSSLSFERLLGALGRKRPVVAIDIAGQGESDPPASKLTTMADHARLLLTAATELGLTKFDVYGRHTGARIGIEMAIIEPDRIRACIFDGLTPTAHGTVDELRPRYPEPELSASGLHFYSNWQRMRDAYLFRPWNDRRAMTRRGGGLPSADRLHDHVLEALKGLEWEHIIHLASASFPVDARLPLVKSPMMLTAAPTDTSWDSLDAVGAVVPHASIVRYPCENYDFRASDDEIVATAAMLDTWLVKLEQRA